MGYEPDYAKDQIIVGFKRECGEDFAESFGEGLGYRLIRYSEPFGAYIFDTCGVDSSVAMNQFLQHRDFIEFAEMVDKKPEQRINGLETIVTMIRSLIDNVAIPDTEYYAKINAIGKSLREL